MNFPIRLIFFLFILNIPSVNAQKSVARDWNEELLDAIRVDYARPTVHARNLFHSSMIMYDAWAVFDCNAETVLLGKTFGGYMSNFGGIERTENPDDAIHEVISFAMFRLLSYRFADSPGAGTSLPSFRSRMESYGYNPDFDSVDYSTGSFPALGNYLAQEVISYGLQDNSYEQEAYENQYYVPINEPLILQEYTETIEIDPNRWQPLSFEQFVDQSGNTVATAIPEFLGPEWGEVIPFSLDQTNMEILNRSFDSYIYNNPGPPVYIQNSTGNGISDPYKWHFALVIAWSAHLDPDDSTLIDISPRALGNVDLESYPKTFEEFQDFYNFELGGDLGTGHAINPITNSIYEPQLVKRADYARVLAEFWADGPDSETPPGHWFTILNYVNDHPQTVKKIEGKGEVLDDLEWDVKSYLALGGAMHDSAINTWGIKGYYDYIRPISAIRYMASKGQSSDVSLTSFHPHGLPLIDGLIEVITAGDSLEGENGENIGKIKTFSWKGPDFIDNPETDIAGGRLDTWNTLVALPERYFCNTTFCWICFWPFYFFKSCSRGSDTTNRKPFLSWRNGYF